MKISFECPTCHKPLEGESEWSGQKAQCPHCQQKFVIPELTSEEVPKTIIAPQTTHKKRSKWLYVFAGMIAIVCIELGVIYTISTKSCNVDRGENKQSSDMQLTKNKPIVKSTIKTGVPKQNGRTSTAKSDSDSNMQEQKNKPAVKSGIKTKITTSDKNIPASEQQAKSSEENRDDKNSQVPKNDTTAQEKNKNGDHEKRPNNQTTNNKKISLKINIGPNQNITDDMGFEDLYNALIKFRYYCCCKDTEPLRSKPITNYGENLSYKQKKQMLKRDHKATIEYIQREYCQPIDQIFDKYIDTFDDYRESFGMMLEFGTYIPLFPQVKCLWHARVLAQRGNSTAQLALGSHYVCPGHLGIENTSEENIVESLKWLELAASSGEARAYWVIGNIFLKLQGISKSIKWYKIGAAAGDTLCMMSLGKICLYSLESPQDSLQWFIAAAERGDMDACVICANIYSEEYISYSFLGEGKLCKNNVKHNHRLCIKYIEKIISYLTEHKKKYSKTQPQLIKGYDLNLKIFKNYLEKEKLKVED